MVTFGSDKIHIQQRKQLRKKMVPMFDFCIKNKKSNIIKIRYKFIYY